MLRFPRALWLSVVCATVLALPSLFADFYCDDQGMVLRLEGAGGSPVWSPFELYTFASGKTNQLQQLADHGPLPWWTSDGLLLSFFRPLSSALFALDHALAGRHPLLYHVHSMAWYAAAVAAAALLFRRLLPEREAALAALLFAVAPAHWMLAAWPSARHVAVSGVFALAAIALHLRSREQASGARLAALAALTCAALSLAGGETALGIFAYVAAYEALGRRDPIAGRLRAFAPWVVLFVAYAVLYKGLGFGVHGSDAYVDPLSQPGRYLWLLPTRLAVFANAALFGIASELSAFAPRAIPILAVMGLVAVAIFALLLRRALRTLDAARARTLAWLLVGAVLATLPGAAGIPGDRILFLPNIGVCAALALIVLHAGARCARSSWGALPAGLGVGVFALVHLVLGPLWCAFNAKQLAATSHLALAAAEHAQIPARPGVRVLGIGLSDPLVGMYLASALGIAPRPEPRPEAVHLLSMSAHDERVRRTAERTLELTILGGSLLDGAFENVVRPLSSPLRAGDVVPLGAWTVCILDDTAGRPTRFSLTLDCSFDDPSIVLLVWQNGALRALPPPPIGQAVLVPHELGPMGI